MEESIREGVKRGLRNEIRRYDWDVIYRIAKTEEWLVTVDLLLFNVFRIVYLVGIFMFVSLSRP